MVEREHQTSVEDNLVAEKARLEQIIELTATEGWRYIAEDAAKEAEGVLEALRDEPDHGAMRHLQGRLVQLQAIIDLRDTAELVLGHIEREITINEE